MGRLRRRHAGPRRESPRQEHLDRRRRRRRASPTDAGRQRRAAALVARRQDTCVSLFARRRGAGLHDSRRMAAMPVKVTSLSTGADNEFWSPDGKSIAFISSVYPDCKDDACNAARDAAKGKKQSEGARLRKAALSATGPRGPTASAAIFSSWPPAAARRATSRPAPTTMCRRSASAARKQSPSRPTARNSASPRTPTRTKPLSTNGDLFTVPVERRRPSRSASPPIPETIGALPIRPTENGSPIARSFSPDTKATAGA